MEAMRANAPKPPPVGPAQLSRAAVKAADVRQLVCTPTSDEIKGAAAKEVEESSTTTETETENEVASGGAFPSLLVFKPSAA